MNKQDTNKIFKQVLDMLTLQDYEDIILSLGGVIYKKEHSKWILYTFCHNVNALDGSPKLYFNLEPKTFHCFSECNRAYNIVTLIQQRFKILGEEKNRFQCLQYIVDTCDLNVDLKNFKFKEESNTKCNWESCLSRYIRHKNSYNELKVYDKSILNNFPKLYHKDWIDEGISIETMEKYNIRYYPRLDQIIIPCYNKDGELIGIRVRNMNKEYVNEGNPKYFPLYTLDGTSYEFPTNQVFYGINYNLEEIKRTGKCMLVEAEKSVLKADSWFGEHNITLALYGSNIGKKRFNEIISWGLTELIIGVDSDFESIYDENGKLTEEYIKFEDKVFKLAKPFKPYIPKISVCYNNQRITDCYKFSPFDFSRGNFDKMYKEREEI